MKVITGGFTRTQNFWPFAMNGRLRFSPNSFGGSGISAAWSPCRSISSSPARAASLAAKRSRRHHPEASRAAFFAGKLGIWTESTSLLRVADEGVAGKFKWRTARFPVPGPDARLPTGGAAAMMFATDPAKQAAAWKYMKFITGPVGATTMVKGTGYMPPNSLPANDPGMLKTYYAEKPNYLTSLSQQPFMTAWYAFPGDNNLKIIQAIKDRLQTVIDKSAKPEAALTGMATDVSKLLPK